VLVAEETVSKIPNKLRSIYTESLLLLYC